MNQLFFDTEFTGLHQKTTLISIGIVADNGKTFYAELTDYDQSQLDDWLRKNVIANLYLEDDTYCNLTDMNVVFKGNSSDLRRNLLKWFSGNFDSVQMWSDCLAYDWVLFCQIFTHAFNIPNQIYYIPFDICPLLLEKTGNANINREEYSEFKGNVKKHNALYDAEIIKACFLKLTK